MRVIPLVLSAILALSLVGCGSTEEPKEEPKAVETVEPKPADKSDLQTCYDELSSTILPEEYTPESYAVFQEKLDKAAEVLADEKATQSQVDSAKSALENQVDDLVEVFNPANYSATAYTDVARDPDAYMGDRLVFEGKVVQVLEGDKEISIRLANNGEYDQMIFCGYSPDLLDFRILEDDYIAIYGTCIGLYSYESTMGAKISLPGMYLDHIELM